MRAFSLLLLACSAARPVQEGVPEQLKGTNDISQHISEARAVHDFRAVRGPSAHMYIAAKLTYRCAAAAAWPPAGWGLRRPWLQAEPVQAREGRRLRWPPGTRVPSSAPASPTCGWLRAGVS